MAVVRVKQVEETDEGFRLEVSVGEFKYKVTLSSDYYEKLSGGKVPPEELVKRSFEFLLEREGPEQILREFDLPLIGHYFPEYEEVIRPK